MRKTRGAKKRERMKPKCRVRARGTEGDTKIGVRHLRGGTRRTQARMNSSNDERDPEGKGKNNRNEMTGKRGTTTSSAKIVFRQIRGEVQKKKRSARNREHPRTAGGGRKKTHEGHGGSVSHLVVGLKLEIRGKKKTGQKGSPMGGRLTGTKGKDRISSLGFATNTIGG